MFLNTLLKPYTAGRIWTAGKFRAKSNQILAENPTVYPLAFFCARYPSPHQSQECSLPFPRIMVYLSNQAKP